MKLIVWKKMAKADELVSRDAQQLQHSELWLDPQHCGTIDPERQLSRLCAWVLLAEVAPELGEWAGFFAAGAGKRAAAEAGLRGAVSDREADDLIREAGTFLAVVARVLGVAHQPTLEPVFDSEGPQLVLVSAAS